MARADGGGPGGFFEELKRRRVVRAVVAYSAIAFLVMQAAELVVPGLGLPDWTFRVVVVVAVLGLPVAAVLAWVFDVTPKGVARTDGADAPAGESTAGSSGAARGQGEGARSSTTAGRLTFGCLIIAVVLLGGWRLFGPGEALAETASIAVLPLDNLSVAPEDGFFALGLTDEILTQLHNVSALRVTSKTSVMPYADAEKNIRAIGQELGVRFIIEGSVQASPDRVRINLQLIDATTDAHLWAETFERSRADLFAVQAEIAGRVARSVNVSLHPEDQQRLVTEPTQDAEAYAWFLRARAHALEGWRGWDRREAWTRATQAYQRAVEIDPDYGLAHAELAMHLEKTMWLGVGRTDEHRRLALESLERAKQVAPESPRTRMAGVHKAYFYDNHWTNALEELERLEPLLPADFDHLWMLGFSYRRVARFEDAIRTLERALELDPLNVQLYYEIGQTYLRMRRYSDAEAVAQRAVQIGTADPLTARHELAVARGDVAEERRLVEAMVAERGPGATVWAQWWLGIHSADFDRALSALDHAPSDDPQAASVRVVTLLILGDTSRARLDVEGRLPELRERFDTDPGWQNRTNLAHALFGVGRTDEGLALLREFLDRPWPQPVVDRWAGPNRFTFEVARSVALAGVHDPAAYDEAFDLLEKVLGMDEYPYLNGAWFRTAGAWDAVRDHPRFQRLQVRADSIDRALGWDPTPTWGIEPADETASGSQSP